MTAPLLGPLRVRNFRVFVIGATIDQGGLWIHLTVIGWLALQLTNSAFLVSIENVAWFLPFLLLALPSGVVADQLDRRVVLITIHCAQSLVLLAMAALAAGGHLSYPLLLILTACVSTAVALDLPIRHGLAAVFVPRAQIVHATGLTQSGNALMRIAGPLFAGVVLSRFGAAVAFACYAAVEMLYAALLLSIDWNDVAEGEARAASARRRNPLRETVDGLRYITRHPSIRGLVILSVGTGVVGWVYLALMPVMARDELGGGSLLLGLLGMAVGLGGLPAGLVLATRRDVPLPGVLMIAGYAAWGAGVMLFALAPAPALAFLWLMTAGAGFAAQSALTQALLLRTAAPQFRGRVFGVLSLIWGANIVGTLTAGSLAETVGARPVIAGSGVSIALVTVGVIVTHPGLLRLR